MLGLAACLLFGAAIAHESEHQCDGFRDSEKLEHDNKAVVARAIHEIVNGGRFELVDELFADDLVEHDAHQAKGPSPKQAFIDAVKGFDRAFPDGIMVIDAQIAEGDMVSTRWHMTGTHRGEFRGIAGTGRSVRITGIFFDRVKDGKLVETWANYDLYGLLEQIRDDQAKDET
ncbi:MAG: ester cyclase [Gammaproteobacteria bacterium]|nr:ester cyclase [Gammaproteobacteria bacterium]